MKISGIPELLMLYCRFIDTKRCWLVALW
jgi:hypothetical protein